jgi:hypothetical protein
LQLWVAYAMLKMLQTHIKFFWTGFGRLLSYSSKTDVFCEKITFNRFQCVSRVSFLPLCVILQLEFGTIPTIWYIFVLCYLNVVLIKYSNAIIMSRVFSLAIEICQICSWQAWRNAIFLRQMHFFVNNMVDPDISDYEFDADDLIRR